MPAPRKTPVPKPPVTPESVPVPDESVQDLNSLLESTPEAPVEPVEAIEDPEDAEIRRLQEELSKPAPAPYVPAGQLTPKQLEIRDLKDRLARRDTDALENAEDVYDSGSGDSIIIHFVADGFTAQGKTWYRGQELEFFLGSAAYEETKDRFGNSWLDLADDVEKQWLIYKKEYFRSGPWRGRTWQDDKAAKEERKRNRAAPLMPVR